MNQDETSWKEQLREAARIAMLLREAEIRRRTADSMRLTPDVDYSDLKSTYSTLIKNTDHTK